jgi:hypothetical protein
LPEEMQLLVDMIVNFQEFLFCWLMDFQLRRVHRSSYCDIILECLRRFGEKLENFFLIQINKIKFLFRVAILSYRYNHRIRQYMKEAYGNPAVKQDPQNTFFQICAFGLPAIFVVIVLVARLVDADELLGLNFILLI